MYGEDAISERAARNWFTQFKNRNFDHNNVARCRHTVEFNEKQFDTNQRKSSSIGPGRRNVTLETMPRFVKIDLIKLKFEFNNTQ